MSAVFGARAGSVGAPARRAVLALLRRIEGGHVELIDVDGSHRSFGDPAAELRATVTVRDARTWWSLLRGGSVGYGESYAQGWWDADDLVALSRILVRSLGPLDRLRSRWADAVRAPRSMAGRFVPRPSRDRNRVDIAAHYDLGNEFFATFLDETMTYSSAVFSDPDEPLASASRRKYDRLLDKLHIGPGQSVLEIGTGWGGFADRASSTRGCPVTTTTISRAQFDRVSRLAESGGLPGVTPLLTDWRDLPARGQRFDRVVSIEMIEAVDWRDYPDYFAAIEQCLAPDGMVGIQAICVPDGRYEAAKHNVDFIKRYIFPGGMLPSTGAIVDAACRRNSLQLVGLEDLSAHYVVTLQRWRERLDEHDAELEAMGLDSWFRRLWRMYFAYCEAGFAERYCTVGQYVFAGPDWRGAPTVDGCAGRPDPRPAG